MSAKEACGPLFDAVTLARKLVRSTDPKESAVAALEAARAGAVTAARGRAWAAVKATPGLTCTELEKTHGVLGRAFGRRLVELEKQKLIRRERGRRCRITNKPAATWWPA